MLVALLLPIWRYRVEGTFVVRSDEVSYLTAPFDGYIKIGAFRNPFGLRMDDHTVATRQGFLDFFPSTVPSGLANLVQTTFLPFDPRSTDEGIEVGADSVLEPMVSLRGRTRVGRGVKIGQGCVIVDSEIADCGRSVILEQVTNGLAARMAVLFLVNGGQGPQELAT